MIKFCLGNRASDDVCFNFFGQSLQFADSVLHLGNRLKYDLSDTEDILLKTRYLIGAANNLFTTLGYVGPSLLSHLFQSHCLALYGCELWKLSSKSLRVLEVAFNNCLRRIWSLSANTHTSILHYCANMLSIYNLVFSRSAKFITELLTVRICLFVLFFVIHLFWFIPSLVSILCSGHNI